MVRGLYENACVWQNACGWHALLTDEFCRWIVQQNQVDSFAVRGCVDFGRLSVGYSVVDQQMLHGLSWVCCAIARLPQQCFSAVTYFFRDPCAFFSGAMVRQIRLFSVVATSVLGDQEHHALMQARIGAGGVAELPYFLLCCITTFQI